MQCEAPQLRLTRIEYDDTFVLIRFRRKKNQKLYAKRKAECKRWCVVYLRKGRSEMDAKSEYEWETMLEFSWLFKTNCTVMLIFGLFDSCLSFVSFKTKCFYTLMHTHTHCACVCLYIIIVFIYFKWLAQMRSLSQHVYHKRARKSAHGRAYFVVGTLYFYSMTEIMIMHIFFDALFTHLFFILNFLFCFISSLSLSHSLSLFLSFST